MAAAYGGLDILVNNAFDSSVPYSSIIDLSTDQLQRNFDIGPIAYLRFMQAAYPHLKASGEGRIINFGSMAGVIGLAGRRLIASREEAVRTLARTAAREWAADNIAAEPMSCPSRRPGGLRRTSRRRQTSPTNALSLADRRRDVDDPTDHVVRPVSRRSRSEG